MVGIVNGVKKEKNRRENFVWTRLSIMTALKVDMARQAPFQGLKSPRRLTTMITCG